MKQAIVLAAALVLTFVATPTAAGGSLTKHECWIDVGAPSILYDFDAEGDQGPAVGGCMLVQDLPEEKTFISYEAWDRTFCRVMYDADGDGLGRPETIEGGSVGPGGDLWAKCDAGFGSVVAALR